MLDSNEDSVSATYKLNSDLQEKATVRVVHDEANKLIRYDCENCGVHVDLDSTERHVPNNCCVHILRVMFDRWKVHWASN